MARGERLIWIGGYTPDSAGKGTGEGIYALAMDPATGALRSEGLAARTSGPSYLTRSADGATMYAVAELDEGRVAAFAIGQDTTLRPLGEQDGAGNAPCHLLVHRGHLLSANYISGSVSVYPIGPDGGLLPRSNLLVLHGHGVDPKRQEGPHAHAVNVAPGGDGLLITDLGTDHLHRYTLAAATGTLHPYGAPVKLPDGTGPRHWIAHPSGHLYIAGELSNTVTVLRWDGADSSVVTQIPATSAPAAGNAPAEVLLSPDTGTLYVTGRGADCVTAFQVTDNGAGLRPLADVPCPSGPRHAALADGYLLVAGQNAGQVAALPIDARTGIPRKSASTIEVPTPTCVLPH